MCVIRYFHCVEPDEITDFPLFLTFRSSGVLWLNPEHSGEVCQVAPQIVFGLPGVNKALSTEWCVSVSDLSSASRPAPTPRQSRPGWAWTSQAGAPGPRSVPQEGRVFTEPRGHGGHGSGVQA